MADQERWRSFLAVELPHAVHQRLEGPLEALATLSGLVRRNPTDRIHLTLVFLGDVEVARIEEIGRLIRPVVLTEPGFSLEVRGVGAFPSMNQPRILWAGIEGPEGGRLMQLRAGMARALVNAGFSLEDREFTPHLTLGRLRRPANRAERAALARWQGEWAPVSMGRVALSKVSLMRSQLSSGSPQYTTLETFGLGD